MYSWYLIYETQRMSSVKIKQSLLFCSHSSYSGSPWRRTSTFQCHILLAPVPRKLTFDLAMLVAIDQPCECVWCFHLSSDTATKIESAERELKHMIVCACKQCIAIKMVMEEQENARVRYTGVLFCVTVMEVLVNNSQWSLCISVVLQQWPLPSNRKLTTIWR